MSELSDILNTAQITKHYEVLHFLSSHANTEYTLAQLDYLIPRGASLQRFPRAWVEFIEAGLCSNQCIEVYYRPVGSVSDAALNRSDAEDTEGKKEIFFVCRRPELRSLEELSNFLQSPSTVPDREGCVALHTDQVILEEALLRESQQKGLLYYFPDNYVKSREHRLLKGKRDIFGTDDALNVFLRDDEADHIFGADGSTGQLELPVGVMAQSMWYTRRGVAVRGKNSIPTRLNVSERAVVIIHRAATSGDDPSASKRAPVLRVSLGQPTGNPRGAPPIEVRVKTSTTSGSVRRSLMDIRAQTRGKVTMSLFVDEVETIVPMEVLDEAVAMPGVMIGREPYPAFPLPDDIRIEEPALWGGGGGEGDATCAESEEKKTGSSAVIALPWWMNSSPAVLKVRDLTLPDNESKAAASRLVWIPHRRDEAALNTVRRALQKQHAAEASRRSRRRRNRNRELRNCHMLHFGFDASVPFTFDQQPDH